MEGFEIHKIALKNFFLWSSALKIKYTVEHDVNSVSEGFRICYSTLAENFVKMFPKPPNKYSINTIIKYYEQIFLGDLFHLASVSENWNLTILKATQVSKAAGIYNLFQRFLKDGAKFLSKAINNLYNLSITSEKFPDSCKVDKLKPLDKNGSLSQPCNYRPIYLLPLIPKVIEKVNTRSSKYLPEF